MIIKSIGSKIANLVHKKDNKTDISNKGNAKAPENNREVCSKEAGDAARNAFIGGQNAVKQPVAPAPEIYDFEDEYEIELTEEEKQKDFEIRSELYALMMLERIHDNKRYSDKKLTTEEFVQEETKTAIHYAKDADDYNSFLQLTKEAKNKIEEVAEMSTRAVNLTNPRYFDEECIKQTHEFFDQFIVSLENNQPT